MLSHSAIGVGETDVVVVKGLGVGVESEVLIRDASRKLSRPLIGVAVGVVKAMLLAGEIANPGEGDGKGVTAAAGTIPVLTDGEATTDPRPTVPLTVMRTGG